MTAAPASASVITIFILLQHLNNNARGPFRLDKKHIITSQSIFFRQEEFCTRGTCQVRTFFLFVRMTIMTSAWWVCELPLHPDHVIINHDSPGFVSRYVRTWSLSLVFLCRLSITFFSIFFSIITYQVLTFTFFQSTTHRINNRRFYLCLTARSSGQQKKAVVIGVVPSPPPVRALLFLSRIVGSSALPLVLVDFHRM